jgi:predicted nucleic acid-binding protein
MKFWDSAAVVPLLVKEPQTEAAISELAADGEVIVWWGTSIECVSAITRRERETKLDAKGVKEALDLLAEMELTWSEIEPSERLRAQARRLLRVHQLRGAESLQLAAALIGAEYDPHSLPRVTLDERLALAAEREGFPVVGPDIGA